MLASCTKGAFAHYKSVGISALANIETSLREAHRNFEGIESCLDFASGYGRVTRALLTKIPASKITAADIDREAVQFCSSEFGTKPLFGHFNFNEISFPEEYDLIWAGSLLTHLPPPSCVQLLKTLRGVLKARGLLIFSTHGESCLEQSLESNHQCKTLQTYTGRLLREGVCYIARDPLGYYGTTLHSTPYIKKLLHEKFSKALRFVRFSKRGWDNHQDVWSYQKI